MIRFRQLSLLRGTKPLFEKAEATLNPGEKVGLVGPNGAGKSSLFSLFLGELAADSGDIDFPAGSRIAHVAQETPALKRPALDYTLDGDVRLRRLQAELAAAEAQPTDARTGMKIAELHTALSDAGAYTASSRAERLLAGLGFSKEQMQQNVSHFSGGWRMRLNLAQALMCQSDLLLLDEPTKGLDSYFKKEFAGILALLKEQGVTVFMISHDIEFCASYADRCGLFFDGNIVACGTPGEFFAGNNFYTTAANRMARRYFPMAVTGEDVVECLKKGV